jgi:transposase
LSTGTAGGFVPTTAKCWKAFFLRKPPTQDGGAPRHYQRRWKVERTIAWVGNFRPLVVRYEPLLTIYRGFFHIACFMIALRSVLK